LLDRDQPGGRSAQDHELGASGDGGERARRAAGSDDKPEGRDQAGDEQRWLEAVDAPERVGERDAEGDRVVVLAGTCGTVTVGGRFNTVSMEKVNTIKITGNSSMVYAETVGAIHLVGAYFVSVRWVSGTGGNDPASPAPARPTPSRRSASRNTRTR
jgi:Protein of unknown function (DUF3060)